MALAEELAVVIDDSDLLFGLCGPNDSHLDTMEELFGLPVRSRGNEIHLEGGTQRDRALFNALIDSLTGLFRTGRRITPDLIRAGFEPLSAGDSSGSRLLRESGVVIPGGTRPVHPRGVNQARFLELLQQKELVFAVGPAGTGKTYLAVAHALRALLTREVRKLILTRPVVEAGESLGYLPGDLTQKLGPYLRPLQDAIEHLVPADVLSRLQEQNAIEVAPLAYMRGRSLMDAYIILDEAQNTTRGQMKMFLTRLGEGSRMVVTGDLSQVDLGSRQQSGLQHALKLLHGTDGIGIQRFRAADVVRHPLVRRIVAAYDADDGSLS